MLGLPNFVRRDVGVHGKTIFILRSASMESALYWSRKLVAKGTITQMEFSKSFLGN
jgi:hypothetical protein